MAKKKKKTFKNPTSLGIDRKNMKFEFSWATGEGYKDQKLEYGWIIGDNFNSVKKEIDELNKLKDTSKNVKAATLFPFTFHNISVDKNDRNKSVSFPESSFYPSYTTKDGVRIYKMKCGGVVFRVSAKSKSRWHKWVYYAMEILPPAKPSISLDWNENLSTQVSFGWSKNDSDNKRKPFKQFYWESAKGSPTARTDKEYAKQPWNIDHSGPRTGYPDSDYIEDADGQSGPSFVRMVRVRSIGPGGDSGWAYAAHHYGQPLKPGDITVNSVKVDKTTGYVEALIHWSSDATNKVDNSLVEYLVGEPSYVNGVLNLPDQANWQSAKSVSDTAAGSNEHDALVQIRSSIPQDQFLWLRIRQVHDTLDEVGNVKLIYSAGITAPSIAIPNPPSQDRLLTVTITNNTPIRGVAIALYYQDTGTSSESNSDNGKIIGLIPWEDIGVQNPYEKTIKLPDYGDKDVSIGARAFIGTYTHEQRSDDVDIYTIDTYKQTTEWGDKESIAMESKINYRDGDFPKAPTNVVADKTGKEGVINVKWSTPWRSSNGAQVAWADHEDALYSTNQPSSFDLTTMQGQMLNVSGLTVGSKWYIWVRLTRKNTDGSVVYGPYAKASPFPIPLTQAPVKPVLTTPDNKTVFTLEESVKFTWVYVTGDTTKQKTANIQISSDKTNWSDYKIEGQNITTEQYLTVRANQIASGSYGTRYFRIQVVSESGESSEYSNPLEIKIASPPVCRILSTSLRVRRKTIDDEIKTINELTALPLTVSVSGAYNGDKIKAIIQRESSYESYHPDESTETGYENETIFQYTLNVPITQTSNLIVVTRDYLEKLHKKFDDGGTYRLRVIVEDEYQQTASDELEFVVNWDHQPIVPEATVEIVTSTTGEGEDVQEVEIATITPTLPSVLPTGKTAEDYATDKVDIYRLSGDKPERVIKEGSFGTTYVDPYPTIGDQGGYRVVMVTADGDYRCSDTTPAWEDFEGNLNTKFQLIDFGGREIAFKYNVSLDNSWDKNFTATRYLGGGIQGDWEKGFSRTGSVKGITLYDEEPEVYQDLRDLGEYDGICRLRTIDGTNIACNINVSESSTYNTEGHPHDVTLSFTRVDNYQEDGMTLAEWNSGDEQ